MHERLDPTHLRRGVAPGPPVGDVADDDRAGEGRAGRLGVGVHLAVQEVEGRDLEAQVDQPPREPLAEKPAPPLSSTVTRAPGCGRGRPSALTPTG